ncbi:MAG: nucleoside-diphosphate kinase [bacterium]
MKSKILFSIVILGILLLITDIYLTNKIFSKKNSDKKIEQTLAMIKPDAVEAKYTGKIIDRIENEGFEIIKIKKLKLTEEKAQNFYAIHKDKSFFDDLVNFMSLGPIIVMILQKEDGIEQWHQLMGDTNPQKAKENTLRRIFGTNTEKNAVHGSDSPQTAKQEILFFWKKIFP